MTDDDQAFEQAARESVELGNRLANDDEEADIWDIADGLLAGAIQYWLYAHQPCGDPTCEDCQEVATAEERLQELLRLTREFAEESEYFHTSNDANVGHA